MKTPQPPADDSLWRVKLRCSFFRGEIKSVKLLQSCGNKKIDAQAISETKGRHAPEITLGSTRHEYWRNLDWSMPKGAPYAQPNPPPRLPDPHVLVGQPFAIITGISAPAGYAGRLGVL